MEQLAAEQGHDFALFTEVKLPDVALNGLIIVDRAVSLEAAYAEPFMPENPHARDGWQRVGAQQEGRTMAIMGTVLALPEQVAASGLRSRLLIRPTDATQPTRCLSAPDEQLVINSSGQGVFRYPVVHRYFILAGQ